MMIVDVRSSMIELLHALILMMLLLGPAQEDACSDNGALGQSDSTETVLDARRFFELLVERYRGLTAYSEMSRIVQVIQHVGDVEPQRVEMEMSSEVTGDALRTETAFSQIRRAFGLNLPLPESEPMQAAELRYHLWLLPHLTLKFSDEPLRDFRDGIHQGFTATDLAPVTVDDRSLVHLELRSGDGANDDSSARFDLYVDPDSMLVERVRGQQRLPDGSSYETTVEITPRQHEGDPQVLRPAYTTVRQGKADHALEDEPQSDAAPEHVDSLGDPFIEQPTGHDATNPIEKGVSEQEPARSDESIPERPADPDARAEPGSDPRSDSDSKPSVPEVPQ
jgi:hypothetical protein